MRTEMLFIKFISLLFNNPLCLKQTLNLSYFGQYERAGRLQFDGWLIPEIGLSIMHVSVWLSPCSLRGALAKQKQKGEDTRGRQFVHICSLLHSFPLEFFILFYCNKPSREKQRRLNPQ